MVCNRESRGWSKNLFSDFKEVNMSREFYYPPSKEILLALEPIREKVFESTGRKLPTEPPIVLSNLLSKIFDLDIECMKHDDIFVFCSVHRWLKESGISWHGDGSYICAFTFYINNHWNNDWGGEHLCEGENSTGAWVRPKPNRLIMNSSVNHKVSKTSSFSDDRITIQGFMSRKKDHV